MNNWAKITVTVPLVIQVDPARVARIEYIYPKNKYGSNPNFYIKAPCVCVYACVCVYTVYLSWLHAEHFFIWI